MMGVEVYGSPLLTSWLNRDLGLAGRITYQDQEEKICEALVTLNEHPLVIPQLAIHLDRNVNDNGLILNKQEHLAALAALDPNPSKEEPSFSYLELLIKEKTNHSSLLATDLFLYPLEKASLIGHQKQMMASYRLDSLASVHAATAALLSNEPAETALKMVVFWDNEEIGSNTAQGAGSPFFSHVLERLTLSLNMSREEYLRLHHDSFFVSVDLGHALNPNYSDKHDARHQSLLGDGILIKSNAQQRYITDAASAAFMINLCKKNNLPFQKFVARSDIPCGTTIGPIQATTTGIKTIDIGIPQLSMHSIREVIACQDHLEMCQLLTATLH
jgi:aspartyl aminopeptidase